MTKVISETSGKEPTLLDRVFTIKPTPRVEKLREEYLDNDTQFKPTALLIDIIRIETRVMKETEGEPMAVRRAKVFSEIVREIPVNVYPGQLIVGYIGIIPHGIPISGDMLPSMLRFSVDRASRDYDWKQLLTAEERRELDEEIIPYWRGQGNFEKTICGRVYQQLPQEILNVLHIMPEEVLSRYSMVYLGNAGDHYGHNTIGYEEVLKKGISGIKKEAEERLNRINLNDPDELKKVTFLKSVVMSLEAASGIGERYAARIREVAEKEQDAATKAELLKIAEICDWVPVKPARTLHEALQSLWFTHMLAYMGTPNAIAQSPARVDQYLYPYYEKDIREGRLTKEEAQELIDCFLLKFNEYIVGGAINVGGYKADGSDATNELSYMFIEAMMHQRLNWPYLDVFLHSRTPDELLIKACQLCALGIGQPVFINNDVLIDHLFIRGTLGGPPVSLEDARTAGKIGCVEAIIPGKDGGWSWGGYSNLGACLEFVVTNGMNRHYNRKMGLETGDPRQFKSFQEVRDAFQKQVAWMIKNLAIIGNVIERTRAELYPTPFESALIKDCIENGISREEGGARYNFNSGIVGAGATDVGDSLSAIKKLVFDEKKITMGALCDALDNNFEGNEYLRKMLLEAPKFGNDDDYADEQTAWVKHMWQAECVQHKNTRGGHWLAEGGPVGFEVYGGMVVGALPSGRQAGERMAPGESPTSGMDVNGPTAVFNSVSKIDNTELIGGMVLNMTLDQVVFKTDDGFKRMADMIRAFVDQRIYHVQFNVVSADILKAAQKEPEKHRDLVVKLSGFNAFFVDLAKPLQDSIIVRTEHGL